MKLRVRVFVSRNRVGHVAKRVRAGPGLSPDTLKPDPQLVQQRDDRPAFVFRRGHRVPQPFQADVHRLGRDAREPRGTAQRAQPRNRRVQGRACARDLVARFRPPPAQLDHPAKARRGGEPGHRPGQPFDRARRAQRPVAEGLNTLGRTVDARHLAELLDALVEPLGWRRQRRDALVDRVNTGAGIVLDAETDREAGRFTRHLRIPSPSGSTAPSGIVPAAAGAKPRPSLRHKTARPLRR